MKSQLSDQAQRALDNSKRIEQQLLRAKTTRASNQALRLYNNANEALYIVLRTEEAL